MSDMNTTIDDIIAENDKIVEEFARMKASLQIKFQDMIKKLFGMYLAKQPKIQLFYWNQYTPYFNDGESCEFGRGEIHAVFYPKEGSDFDDLDTDFSEFPSVWNQEGFYKTDLQALKDNGFNDEEIEELRDFLLSLQSIPEDVYETMFGDHVEVTVSREGISTSEYSHD